jgi:uncharacterized damage-inducible protein DinB
MNTYFYRLFRFNNWANQIIGDFLLDHQISDPDCVKLMSHLLLAQTSWFGRVTEQQNDQPVWDALELNQVVKGLQENGEQWLEYIQALDESRFGEITAYRNMAGQPQKNLAQDILIHVVNHATYHRGQLARRIREIGFAPPSTDYIQFARIISNEPIV